METECDFLVDSEIWPNLILSAKSKKFHYALLMRDYQKSYNRWLVFLKQQKNL